MTLFAAAAVAGFKSSAWIVAVMPEPEHGLREPDNEVN
jgi:hypothetical protein